MRNNIPASAETIEVDALPVAERLVTKPVMALAASVSPRLIDVWAHEKKIPVVRISPRCLRYHIPSVLAALRRFTVEEVK